jgi:transcription factor IIIB subunit 2
MSTSFCSQCQEETLSIQNINDGNTVCSQCGLILEENTIISSIQFNENSSGGATVVGQFIGEVEGN